MKKLVFDSGNENLIREALGLKVLDENDKGAFGYVTIKGEVQELVSYGELLQLDFEE